MRTGFEHAIDASLLARARRGDRQAHAQLFHLFGAPVFTLARRIVRRHDVAEEILQDTFVEVIRQIDSYRNDAPFGFWLRRIAVNRALMFLRSYAERNGEAMPEEWPDDGSPLEDALQRTDLLVLLDQLPDSGRAVLWLHEVEGYTHQEIGELMGRTTSFSKSQLARAHARLRALVQESNLNEVTVCTSKRAN